MSDANPNVLNREIVVVWHKVSPANTNSMDFRVLPIYVVRSISVNLF